MDNFTSGNSSTVSSRCFTSDSVLVTTLRVFAYVVIIVVSLIANSIVVFIVSKDKVMRKTMNLFIINLCVADLLITMVYMPRVVVMLVVGTEWLVAGIPGLVLCKLVPYFHHASLISSVLTLLALSVDRFNSIMFPLKRRLATKGAKVMIAAIWGTALVARAPYLYALKIKTTVTGRSCSGNLKNVFDDDWATKAYYTALLIVFYIIPLVLICSIYTVMIIYLRRKKKPGVFPRQASAQGQENRYRRASRKTVHMLASVSFAFVLCWLTYFLAKVVLDRIPCNLRFWRFFLAHLNSAVSPCLFLALNRGHYRKQLRGRKDVSRFVARGTVTPAPQERSNSIQ